MMLMRSAVRSVAARAWTAAAVGASATGVVGASALAGNAVGRRWAAGSAVSDGGASDGSEVSKPVAGAAGTVPDLFDQATGLERAELEMPDIFAHNEPVRGPFGTEENPTMIESAFASRIVGCTGEAAPKDHDIHWLEVKKGEKISCPLCGQFFALKSL